MKKTFRFIDSSSNILNFEAYFCYDYKDFLNKNYTEKTDYESQNVFEKVFSDNETFIGVFSENPLGFRTFIKTNDIVLIQYIRSLKFIFYNPNDNFYELHFFEILTKEDIVINQRAKLLVGEIQYFSFARAFVLQAPHNMANPMNNAISANKL